MSARRLFIFLALFAVQHLISGEEKKLHEFGKDVGKGFHSSGRHMDEQPEYETEKRLLIREKRQNVVVPPAVTPTTDDTSTGVPITEEPTTDPADPAIAPPADPPIAAPAVPSPTKVASVSSTPSPKNGTISALALKRVAGFTKVFLGLSSGLVFLAVAHVGFFIWLMIVLKKVKKP